MITTVYQFCTPCNKEKVHQFTEELTLTCSSCKKNTKVLPYRTKLQPVADTDFMQELISGSMLPKVRTVRKKKTKDIVQPVALLNMLNRIGL